MSTGKVNFTQTEIGRIPKEWEIVPLKGISEINKESIDPAKEFPDHKFLYIDIDSVENETGVIRNAKEIIGKSAPSRARRLIHQNDVLMSTVRPYLKAFTIVPKKFNNQICSTGFAVLTCGEKLLPLFLLYSLFAKSVLDQCKKMMVGGQYPALTASQVSNIEVLIPPLPEQKKIAEILSTVDQAIEKVNEAIKKTQRLKKGLMQELLTKGIGHREFKETKVGRIPKEWELVKLSNVFKLASGKLRPKEISEIHTQKMAVPVYGGNGILGYTNRFMIDNETIVIGRVGEYCGSIHKTQKSSWVTDNALYALAIEKHKVNLDFLTYYLAFINLNKFKRESGQPLMTQTIVYSISCPLPPLPEQQKIAEILSTVDERLELIRKRKERLERTKKGLMNDLLTGRKRVRLEA